MNRLFSKQSSVLSGQSQAWVFCLLLTAYCLLPTAHADTLAASDAPRGTENWLSILGWCVALLLGLLKLREAMNGTKIQQPLTVQESAQYATASAFSRHCSKQDADLSEIRRDNAEAVKSLASELHNLSREVSDINGRSEVNFERLERVEKMLAELLQRLPLQTRPR